MAVIAVYSMKGGVGKTTMAVDLAWRFSQTGGHETLLYDLDPQGGLFPGLARVRLGQF